MCISDMIYSLYEIRNVQLLSCLISYMLPKTVGMYPTTLSPNHMIAIYSQMDCHINVMKESSCLYELYYAVYTKFRKQSINATTKYTTIHQHEINYFDQCPQFRKTEPPPGFSDLQEPPPHIPDPPVIHSLTCLPCTKRRLKYLELSKLSKHV